MKKLIITDITDVAQFPIKKGTLQFLQDAHVETVNQTIISMIGSTFNPFTVYVLWGCVNSGVYPAYSITQGAVFYGGEVYSVDATSFTATGANVAVLNVAITQYTSDADPVTFTDASVHNVHNVRKMAITAGAGGSGLANYSAVVFYPFSRPVASQADVDTGTEAVKAVTPATLLGTPSVMGVDGAVKLHTKVLDIGDWDMDTNAVCNVAHGVSDFTKLRSAFAVILNDTSSTLLNLATDDAGVAQGSVNGFGSTVQLSRLTGGVFDSAFYNATSFNRGFVTITYTD